MSEFITYAQNFEDLMLWRALQHVQQGFYIDVGAADPEIDSVTKAFYDIGWRGLNIEPHPELFLKLVESRPRDINLDCVVGATAGTVDFHKVAGSDLSTIDATLADRHTKKGYPVEVLKVAQRTLTDICRQYAPPATHFLKIDVEGAEAQVLRGAHFDKFRPWIILLEATEPDSSVENWREWEPELIASGYCFAWFDGLNRFYLAKEHASTLGHAFKVPPNVFDCWRRPAGVADQTVIARFQARPDAATRDRDDARTARLPITAQSDTKSARLVTDQADVAAAGKDHAVAETMLAAAQRDLEAVQSELAATRDALTVTQDALADTRYALERRGAQIAALLGSTSWKLTSPVRAGIRSLILQRARLKLAGQALLPKGTWQRAILVQSIRRRFGPQVAESNIGELPDDRYREWVLQFDTLRDSDRNDISHYPSDGDLPKILVLVCINTETKTQIMDTIARLRAQIRDNWHVLVCCGPDCKAALRSELQTSLFHDPHFAIVYHSDSQTNWSVPVQLPVWTYVVVMAAGILLRPHALYTFAAHALTTPSAHLIYSDEDQVPGAGSRQRPFFKPDFCPELLRSLPYLGRCYLLLDGKPDLQRLLSELFLPPGIVGHVTQLARGLPRGAVHHISAILFHDYASVTIPDQTATPHLPEVSELPRVSIIIPTRNGLDVLVPCLTSIRRMTTYPSSNVEIIVVDNNSDDPQVVCFLEEEAARGRVQVLSYSRPFNYSEINNYAVSKAVGDILVFLNNDTEIIHADWLQFLCSYAMQDDVGAVGTKLLYPDHTIQHGGVVLGVQGVAAHAHVGLGQNASGYYGLAKLTHGVSAVTGACLAMRRSVFQQIAGFDKNLSVAFNDVLLCLRASSSGYRNIYIGTPLLIHYESRSRGLDDTPRKQARFWKEADYARQQYSRLFKLDPYYNSQLSLEHPYGLAFPPRTAKPWRYFARRDGVALRILMLSVSHQIGHGVAVVLKLQAAHLVAAGFEVFVGGPVGPDEFDYKGSTRVALDDPIAAARFAFEQDIDCIVAHTRPFFSTFRWLGDWPRSIAYDHGEPIPDLFPDARERRNQLVEKRFCISMADRAFAISRPVQAESGYWRMGVIPLGNSHLAVWDDALASRRAGIRASLGLGRTAVILNVCRFHQTERHWKGVDVYAEIAALFRSSHPELEGRFVFVLAGKASTDDVSEMEARGLRVFGNVPDSTMIDLYAAADVYMNFSRWAGYNLGIGQALALGLPVIASDIPAHQEFPIATTSSAEEAVRMLGDLVVSIVADEQSRPRQILLSDWSAPLEQFAAAIAEVCHAP